MNILICEPEFPTHYHFIQHLIPQFHSRLNKVFVGVKSNADSDPLFQNTISLYSSLPKLTLLKDFEGRDPIQDKKLRQSTDDLLRRRNVLRMEDLLKRNQITDLIVMSADKLIPLVLKRKKDKSGAIWDKVNLHFGVHWVLPAERPSISLKLLARFSAKAQRRLHTLKNVPNAKDHESQIKAILEIRPKTLMLQNVIAFDAIQKFYPKIAGKIVLNPIPIEIFEPIRKESARKELALPPLGQLIGFVGSIQQRKGILPFLSAFKQTQLKLDTRVLLAGPFDDFQILGLINEEHQDLLQSGRLIIRDGVMNEMMLHKTISALDVLVCNCSNSHQWSSDMALRSMVAERPILTSNGKWFQYMVSNFCIGMTFPNPGNIPSVARCLEASLEAASAFKTSTAAKKIIEFNRPENYANTIIRAVLGKNLTPAQLDLVEWPIVRNEAGN